MNDVLRLHRAAHWRLAGGISAIVLPLAVTYPILLAGHRLVGTPLAAFVRWCPFTLAPRSMPWMWATLALVALPPALGVLTSAARRVRKTRQFCRFLADLEVAWPTAYAERIHSLGLDGRVRLWPAEVADVRTVGLWRPTVLCTTRLVELLTPGEFGAVLLHEAHHMRRRDPLKLLAARSLRDGFSWLPVVRSFVDLLEMAQEFAADAAATVGSSRRALASALLKLLTAGESAGVRTPAVAATSFTGTAEVRLAHLIEGQPPSLPPLDSGQVARSLLRAGAVWSALLISCLVR